MAFTSLNEYLDQVNQIIEDEMAREEREKTATVKIKVEKLKKLIEKDPRSKAYWIYICNSTDLSKVYELEEDFIEWVVLQ